MAEGLHINVFNWLEKADGREGNVTGGIGEA